MASPPKEGLPPAAEEALRDLAERTALDLRIPHCIAREGLLYAAKKHGAPLGQVLLRAATLLRLEEQPVQT